MSLTIIINLFSHQTRNKYIFSLNINSIRSNLVVKPLVTTVDEQVTVAKIKGALATLLDDDDKDFDALLGDESRDVDNGHFLPSTNQNLLDLLHQITDDGEEGLVQQQPDMLLLDLPHLVLHQ